MNNHKTRDFLTRLPAAETWITPGWCSRKPDFRMPDGCGTSAMCDIDLAGLFCVCSKHGVVQDSIERSCECGHMKRTDKALVCPICSTWIE